MTVQPLGITPKVYRLCWHAGSVLYLLTVVFGGSEFTGGPSLEELMPRLWPLFRHPLPRVRLAAVECLQAFLPASSQAYTWMTASLLHTLLRCVTQLMPMLLCCASLLALPCCSAFPLHVE